MPFVKHVDQKSLSGLPAKVALVSNGGSKLPCLTISFRAAFAAEAEIKSTDRYDLLVGTEEDKGVVLLKRSEDGLYTPRLTEHLAVFRFPSFDKFGMTRHKQERCAAEIVNPEENLDLIEVTLPAWAVEDVKSEA
ncbi:hypothetical protein LQG66_03975 [Bradyrhizobium ontarionense]|uniref:Uncharacterized protein n=1 Tax=Bradyrhizobium ontarionense TaxID=2898149 RepID=A0ABY3RDI8_9BRAD|nr:hypothetical protein [Bradyrhizobium sp. A19]UFZ05485.1 hypothetical protein LQG66_03975 [Bradyrhizobium sp. A19]